VLAIEAEPEALLERLERAEPPRVVKWLNPSGV
jgi:hypothetical protein